MKKDLTKHTRSAWKQPVWWKYIVAFFIILINALPLYVLIEMSLKQSTDLASYARLGKTARPGPRRCVRFYFILLPAP